MEGLLELPYELQFINGALPRPYHQGSKPCAGSVWSCVVWPPPPPDVGGTCALHSWNNFTYRHEYIHSFINHLIDIFSTINEIINQN